jgi:GNAT superfamily N-acetyltransferase
MRHLRMHVRLATRDDAVPCADIHTRARKQMTFLPTLHTAEEVLLWKRETVLVMQEVIVAEIDGRVVGYAALNGNTLTNLYVDPHDQNQGVGSVLLRRMKVLSPNGIEAWVFEPNVSAVRFYERHEFRTVRVTDGGDNDERVPDRLMTWHPEKLG